MLNLKKTLTKLLALALTGEHRTLLWTNPSPNLNFAPQDILTSTDFTVYDEIEIIGINYTTYGSIMPCVRIPRGQHGNLIGIVGSSGDADGMGYLVARGVRLNDDKIIIYEAKGVATNGTSWVTNNNNMVPYKIYGIKLGGGN